MRNSKQDFIMKNNIGKYQRSLDCLFTINTLRQDCLLFTKLLAYKHKKPRSADVTALAELQQQRMSRQESLLENMGTVQMNENWKSYLFGFCNKIAKIIKSYQMKLIHVQSKWADLGETACFLHKFRNQCIQTLGECVAVGQFVRKVTEWLRKRYEQQVYIYTSNSNKFTQLIRKQQSHKVNRYLFLLSDRGPQLFIDSHQKTMLKWDQEVKRMFKGASEQSHPMSQLTSIMNLDEQLNFNEYVANSSVNISFSYLEEGLCQFLVSKWQRIVKDIKLKNEYNQRVIDKFIEKHNQFSKRNRVLKPEKKYKNSTLSFNQQRVTQDLEHPETNISSYFDISVNHQSQLEGQPDKKMSIFKVPSVTARKRSNTLRPLGEQKQNKEIFPQKIIQMKLVDSSAPTIKNMRIRKRKAFPVLRDENSWSLLIRQSQQPPKLAICLH